MLPEPVAAVPDAATRLKHLYTTLEPIAKGSVAAVAICYALGLLIKNAYLARWGSFSAHLIEVEYVLTGALFLLINLMGIAYWSCTLGMIRRMKLQRNKEASEGIPLATLRARVKMTMVTLAGASVVAAGLAFVYRSSTMTWQYGVAVLVTILVFPGLIFLAWKPIADMWSDFTVRKVVPGEAAMRFFLRMSLLLIVLFLFIEVIYPMVSPMYGGGRHTDVEVRVKTDSAPALHAIGCKQTGGENAAYRAELVFDDGTYFTLVTQSDVASERRAVRLHRDQVLSITTQGGAPAWRYWK